LKIIVCIKQVPETNNIDFNPSDLTINRSRVNGIINPFDLNAIEEAVRIKEKFDDVTISVISMGPPSFEKTLKEALTYGLDSAYLISDKLFAGSDTFSTAYILAESIKAIGDFDLILCGKQAIDGETGQVGPEIAENLKIPQATNVKKIEFHENKKIIKVESDTENGYRVLEVKLPALITVNKEINVPRIPSFKDARKALKIPIIKWDLGKLKNIDKTKIGLTGSPTKVVNIEKFQKKKDTKFISGTPNEIVNELYQILKDKHVV